MKLYSYYRSSAAYRVRIALNLKQLDYDYVPINLLEQSNKGDAYLALNPQGLVPALELGSGEVLAQSMAIIEWLEESYPQPPLLPVEPLQRARIRSLVNNITCDLHPLCNISVSNYLRQQHALNDIDLQQWMKQWMQRSFKAVEQMLAANNSHYSFSDSPCMADIVLVPQLYNARRFNIALDDFPHMVRVVENCERLPAFIDAQPSRQVDSK